MRKETAVVSRQRVVSSTLANRRTLTILFGFEFLVVGRLQEVARDVEMATCVWHGLCMNKFGVGIAGRRDLQVCPASPTEDHHGLRPGL